METTSDHQMEKLTTFHMISFYYIFVNVCVCLVHPTITAHKKTYRDNTYCYETI